MSILLLLLLCFTCSVCTTTTTAAGCHHQNRRLLHQPFFPPQTTSSTSLPPVALPQAPLHSQQPPKYPFSSSTSTPQSERRPFFPTLTSPPPPPPLSTTTLPTFPANISSLLFPHSSPSSSSSSHLHLIVLSVSISLSLLFIATLSVFFLHSRRLHHHSTTPASSAKTHESLRLFPPNTLPSDASPSKPPPPPPPRPTTGVCSTSSEFLYLGTLVNSHASIDAHERAVNNLLTPTSTAAAGGTGFSSSSPYHKLGSPELKPLPPLPKNNYTPTYRSGEVLLNNSTNYNDNVSNRNASAAAAADDNNEDEEEEEEFFSPRGSSGRKETSLVHVDSSSSRREFSKGLQGEPFGSRSFNSRTASYPHSDSCSPVNNNDNNSISTSPSVVLSNVSPRSSQSDEDLHPIAALPAPIQPSPSLLASFSSGADSGVTQNSNSGYFEPRRMVAPSTRMESAVSNQAVQVKLPPPPPPPPPPLPPHSLWDVQVGVRAAATEVSLGPPVLVAPSGSVLVPNAMPGPECNDETVAERSEETPRPKLKPLHWDKVRASSDRVMVWDQMKSSSFQ